MLNVAGRSWLVAVLMFTLLAGLSGCGAKKTTRVPPASPGSGRSETPAAVIPGPTRQPTVQIKADPSTLRPGENFTLTWSSTDAERLTIDQGVGTVSDSGSLRLRAGQSATYTATAANRLGSASASTRVTVTEPVEPVVKPAPSPDIGIEEIISRGLIKDVFFDYDQHTLSSEAQQILQRDAEYLRKNSSASFILEGHCDERGTSEYNLALGDRRAQAVKEYLVSLGISASRLETVSYGEERPFASGHDEASWAQNRRVHFTLRR
ncbi:MAG TPA: peptidoglycan-associated lipoprotein Pal [Acidobacteriota bacterium]|jgi:peptidoglycan-associated lipoprotein